VRLLEWQISSMLFGEKLKRMLKSKVYISIYFKTTFFVPVISFFVLLMILCWFFCFFFSRLSDTKRMVCLGIFYFCSYG